MAQIAAATASVSSSAQGIASAPTSDAALGPDQYANSVAIFRDERLVACVDAVWIFPKAKEFAAKAGKSVEFILGDDVGGFVSGDDSLLGDILNEAIGKEATGLLRLKGKPQPIRQICDRQFPDRTIVSSCVLGAGKQIRVGLDIRSFDAMAGNDRFMRGCLAAKADWQELTPDSREFKRERLQQRFRALQQDIQ